MFSADPDSNQGPKDHSTLYSPPLYQLSYRRLVTLNSTRYKYEGAAVYDDYKRWSTLERLPC